MPKIIASSGAGFEVNAMRSMQTVSESSSLTRAEMTHRIGRFYTGQPSWRTRLRDLRRRLGNASLPPSEEEWLMQMAHERTRTPGAAKGAAQPMRALRIAWPLPPVLLAHDGRTTFRYVKVLKNASTTMLNLLLEITGEAAYRSWNDEADLLEKPSEWFVRLAPGRRLAVDINQSPARIHHYLPARAFAPEPYADIRFCVVRDPVERFVATMVQFRIMTLQSKGRLVPVTSDMINKWADRMAEFYAEADGTRSAHDNYAAANERERHLLRQTDALGKDAGWYTHIFSTRRPEEFYHLLSQLAGKPLSPFDAKSLSGRQKILRTQGMSLERPQLSAAQRRRVEALYAEDYRVFGRWF